MTIDDVKRVCVIGGGLMGRQIALNTAIYGYEVVLCDTSEEVLEKVRVWMEEYLAGRIAKGKMTKEQTEEYKSRICITPSLEEALKDVQLVIEAIVEIRDVKFELFRKLNKLVPGDTILTSNSSTMVSSMFKDLVENPSRLANLHYFNPALVMKLIEVVQGDHTSDSTADLLMEFSRRTGKTPIRLTKECEGFVVNRALGALKRECLKIF
jgi:3-hydroxybutyryl-CoA dehydrogenase